MSKTTDEDSTTNKCSLYMGSIPIPSSTSLITLRRLKQGNAKNG